MSKRFTTAEFIKISNEKHDFGYDYLKSDYINTDTVVIITCRIHGDFLQKPSKHMSGQGCPDCGRDRAAHKLARTKDEFIYKANAIHNNYYNYDLSIYINDKTKIKIICPTHGSFDQTPNAHLQEQGCPQCGVAKNARNQTKSLEQFILDAYEVHLGEYDYSRSIYVNSSSKIEIICSIHGSFFQAPANHLIGQGCKKCFSQSLLGNLDGFVRKANLIHNHKYDYSTSFYASSLTKTPIICPTHGTFYQTPDAHLHTNGCYECGRMACGLSRVKDIQFFIDKASILHNHKYDYSKTIYLNNRLDVIIICPVHGEFSQMAMSHLAGKACFKCSRFNKSYSETKWLDLLNIPTKNRNIRIMIGDTLIIPDGFDPLTNTIYEFYGDYWHGNPNVFDSNDINSHNGKTFGELYSKTIEREIKIKNADYKLITIWQKDFR